MIPPKTLGMILVSFSLWQWPQIPYALELVDAAYQSLPLMSHDILLVCLFFFFSCDRMWSLLLRTLVILDLGSNVNVVWPHLNMITSTKIPVPDMSGSLSPRVRNWTCVFEGHGSTPNTVFLFGIQMRSICGTELLGGFTEEWCDEAMYKQGYIKDGSWGREVTDQSSRRKKWNPLRSGDGSGNGPELSCHILLIINLLHS